MAQPLLIPAGSKLRTHCTWNNTTDKPLAFPEEMCVFATITLGEKDATCIDGKFNARAPESANASMQPTAAGAAMSPGAAGSAAPAQPGAAGSPAAAPTASAGACTSDADKAIIEAADFQDKQRMCGSMCLGAADSCASDCFSKNTTLSTGCAGCAGAQITCAMMHCIGDCAGGFSSASCMPCLETNCGAAYHACSGL